MTDAERHLWQRLRGKAICGVQFYRQKPLLLYIVDFHAPAAGLVVELDGGQHFEIAMMQADARRTAALNRLGLIVLRYDNRAVLLETEAVLDDIHRVVVARLGRR